MGSDITIKLWVISNCRPNSGWGTYVDNLKNALEDKAKFINLFGSIQSNKCIGDPAIVPARSKIKSIIARSIPKIYFNNLIKNIEKERSNGLIVHYAYNLLPLLGNNDLDIVTIHDLIFLSRSYKGESLLKSVYSRNLLKGYLSYKNIITVSNSVRKMLLNIDFSKEIEVIYPPCPPLFKKIQTTESDKKKLNLPIDKILILSPSNDKPWKNLNMVLKAMKKLGDKYLLVRVGPSLGTGVTFNNISPDTLNLIYNVCDILLFPSLEEGFGFPVVEAMKTGLPAVVSDIEVFHEIASDAVEYVNQYDVDSIVSGILRALDRREKLIKLGYNRSTIYKPELFKEKMLSYYERVANNLIH
jgi:glycosyltransferase involved in cell wall biosynthesis